MSGKDNIMDNNNNGNDFNGNGFEDYSDARKYTYNPYTGQRNVNYGYEGGSAQTPPPKKPKKSKKGWWIALIAAATALIILASGIAIGGLTVKNAEAPAQSNTQTADENAGKNDATSEDGSLNLNKDSASLKKLLGDDATLSDVAQNTIKSVVCIENYQKTQGGFEGFMGGELGQQTTLYSEGSGVVITEDGYVITNQHVVDGSDSLQVMMSDGTVYDAKIIGQDVVTDLALIKIEADGVKFTPMVIGDSDELSVASYVMAVGNPGGSQFSSSVTLGIVSALERPITITSGYTINMIQTDAAINPGNSGGALVNMNGELIGICSAKYVKTGYDNMGFAISINEAMPIIEQLKEYGYVKRGTMDIEYQTVTQAMAQYYNVPQGLYVIKAGEGCSELKKGDIITEVEGTQVTSNATLTTALANKNAGETATVKYYSMMDKEYHVAAVTLVESSSAANTEGTSSSYSDDDGYRYYYGGNGYYGN